VQSDQSRGGGTGGAHRDWGKTAAAALILREPGSGPAIGLEKRQGGTSRELLARRKVAQGTKWGDDDDPRFL
jgi:hypothetical protein